MKRNFLAKIAPGVVLLALVCPLVGCRSEYRAPDVSHLDGSFELIRSEQVLFGLDTLAPGQKAQETFSAHPVFWDLYFTQIMSPAEDSAAAWRDLLMNPFLQAIADSVAAEYHDMEDIRNQFTTAFQYLQFYFPGNRVPHIYTLISGFGYFPFIFEDGERDGLGVSLEMFLGADFPYHSFTRTDAVFSDYLVRTYNRDHLVKRTLDVLVDDLKGPPSGDRLLDLMIHNGIKLYIVEQLQPQMPDTVLFEFTPDQLAWCNENERNLWAHFLTEDLIYSSEKQQIQRLLSPSPMIPGMPAEAPGGVANWTGWRIIHTLMENEPSLKPVDLIAMLDAQSVLENAKYRPR